MKILYVKNSSDRAKEFQLRTVISEENGQRFVKKEILCKEALPHLMKMKDSYIKLQETIISPKIKLAKIIHQTPTSLTFEFVDGISLENRLHTALQKNEEEATKIVDEYMQIINENFKTLPFDNKQYTDEFTNIFGEPLGIDAEQEICLSHNSNIDLIFSNLIYRGEEIYIIDYEWVFDFPIPLNYIFYRGIYLLDNDSILKRYFSTQQIERFAAYEKHFLLGQVLNKQSFYQIQHHYLKNKYTVQDEIALREKQIGDRDQHIKELERHVGELEDIAQSLRIKNRIKRLYPNNTIAAIQTLIKNPQIFKKVFFHLKQGNIKFLLSRAREKLGKNSRSTQEIDIIDLSGYFEPFDVAKYHLGDLLVDIIIPVYNGYEFLPALFNSIKEQTSSPYRLIVINDCSPDERVKPYLLERLKEHPTALFIEHEENMGFLKSVNEARTYVSNHFLILNTDTEVPEYWLERMMYPIIHGEKVASTTPFTNSGEIASFPNFIADNPIFDDMKVDDLDKAFRDMRPDPFYEPMPTGVGFCMGVNYHLTQEIGFFTEDKFGKGYGEENDWCQRAIKEGFQNLLVPNLFVYHKHGGSFSTEEKQRLLNENYAKLTQLHPNYAHDVHQYIQRDPHRSLRKILMIAASSKSREGISLIIDHDLGGGANHYREELVEKQKEEGRKILQLLYDLYADRYILHFDYKEQHISFAIEEFDGIKKLFEHSKFKEIFINNLVSFPHIYKTISMIKELSSSENTDLVIPIHDFYPICPSYTLLNDKGEFCNIPSIETCQECIGKNDLEWKTYFRGKADLKKWRAEWSYLLESASEILCFSYSSKDILQKAYPLLDEANIIVKPHSVEPLEPVVTAPNKSGDEIVIGILGGINYSKGSKVIQNLTEEIDKRELPIRVVLIGEISDLIRSKSFQATGRYKRDDLPKLVEELGIDIFFIPSIWPETFSYTTQEVMMMDMPLMVFDLGAPAERVKKYDKGIVLEDHSIEKIISIVTQIQSQG
ncbi:MAG: hypothetical protein DRG30_07930 [Epsilonproteobacteria bacterium]|nr:MAG: hypothetical protein DRG30_07930 [Campylobacterota bacterium]